MKNYMKILAILLALAMFVSFPCAVFADPGDALEEEEVEEVEDDEDEIEIEEEDEDEDEDEDEIEEEEEEEEEDEDEDDADEDLEDQLKDEKERLEEEYEAAMEAGDVALADSLYELIAELEIEIEELDEEEVKPWEAAKDALEAEKDALESEKDALEDEIESLEEQIAAAEEVGNELLVADLEGQKALLQEKKNGLKAAMKSKLEEMHDVMRTMYTPEEIADLDALADELDGEEGIDVIPFTNVLVKGRSVKFDTPPVIKEGRLLLPLRSISTATGADVTWDNGTKEITVVKDAVEIVLKIEEVSVTVNGEETDLDVPAELINSRTVVPARFIAESLGLEVTYDAATETVMVEQPEE